jgi:exopolysaccharide biosynthesis polyprenyl glycosylphosphotransferase
MLKRHGQMRMVLLVLGDLLTTALALLVAYFLRFHTLLLGAPEPWEPRAYVQALVPALALALLAYALAGGYRPPRIGDTRGDTLRLTIRIVLAATLLLGTATLLFRDLYAFSRGMLGLFPVAAVPAIWLGRRGAIRALAKLHQAGRGTVRALVVGEGHTARELEERLVERPWTGVRVVGRIRNPEDLPREIAGRTPDEVYLVWPAQCHRELARSLELLREALVDVRVVPDLPDDPGLNRSVSLLGGLPVVTLRESPFFGINRLLKRGTDLLLGGLLLVLFLPLMLLVALAILVTSGRPILYRQERMGLDGRLFTILKFRSMRRDAEEETGAVWARSGDPRCTRLGSVLRRLAIDELPQLVNVLRGDMSLVGPRPERPELIHEFRKQLPHYMLRHRIPAGLTGWAQVNGLRGDTDLGDRLTLDLEYFRRWSPAFDLEILLRTIWRVLAG